ncbi:hypothetical protein [uncultured Microbulbifer sp.]|uniref:hypothetical protein n=1 Tax=uncultured Microbulbifer sp. TaxID=348147 RepID=UPI0026337A25|nr:hypothetical protein [uncultured Microbulbifer sp.]
MTIFDTVKIPDTDLCKMTLKFVQGNHDTFLLNHVMRTYFFGACAGQAASAKIDLEMLFLGSTLHDLGLVKPYVKDKRFEVDGANGAAAFLHEKGYPEEKIEVIWDAIALHSTLEIAQHKRPEIALVQFGAGIDIGAIPIDSIDSKTIDEIIDQYPRVNFTELMLKRISDVTSKKPETTMFNFTADIAERYNKEFKRTNFCDLMHNSDFSE